MARCRWVPSCCGTSQLFPLRHSAGGQSLAIRYAPRPQRWPRDRRPRPRTGEGQLVVSSANIRERCCEMSFAAMARPLMVPSCCRRRHSTWQTPPTTTSHARSRAPSGGGDVESVGQKRRRGFLSIVVSDRDTPVSVVNPPPPAPSRTNRHRRHLRPGSPRRRGRGSPYSLSDLRRSFGSSGLRLFRLFRLFRLRMSEIFLRIGLEEDPVGRVRRIGLSTLSTVCEAQRPDHLQHLAQWPTIRAVRG